MTSHTKESKARMDANNKDRERIERTLSICIYPLNPTHQPSGMVNIVTGEIGPESVNIDQAVSIGWQQMVDFQATWPEGFNETICRKIVTFNECYAEAGERETLVSLILHLSTRE